MFQIIYAENDKNKKYIMKCAYVYLNKMENLKQQISFQSHEGLLTNGAISMLCLRDPPLRY